jgi:RNA polymerase primary sigma factor
LSEKKSAAPISSVPDERQSQLKLLIAKGKEQGFLTYGEVNDHLPSEIVDPEQIEDIVNMINDMGIPVYEKAPDAESLILADGPVATDDEAVEEAAAALATVDAEFGRTTDPVRMYMREMGTVELLTREGEIRIAKRIEEGLDAVRSALANFPATYDFILGAYEPVKAGQGRLADIIVGRNRTGSGGGRTAICGHPETAPAGRKGAGRVFAEGRQGRQAAEKASGPVHGTETFSQDV